MYIIQGRSSGLIHALVVNLSNTILLLMYYPENSIMCLKIKKILLGEAPI